MLHNDFSKEREIQKKTYFNLFKMRIPFKLEQFVTQAML